MLCPKCGAANKNTDVVCTHCATPLPAPPQQNLGNSHGGCLSLKGVLVMVIVGFCIWAYVYAHYRELSTRDLMKQTFSDMRELATAIEAYFIDNSAYPAWSVGPNSLNGSEHPSFMLRTPQNGLATITTPIAYIEAYLQDPFKPRGKPKFNFYSVEYSWLLWSAGPDRDYDIDLNVVQNMIDWDIPQPASDILHYAYDPTNGTTSSGDIIRFKN